MTKATQPSPKDLSAALAMIATADPTVVKGLLADASLEKAAQMLKDSEIVSDRWEEGQGQAGATKEQIKTGPQAAASGDGAEKMVSQYSETTAQRGATLVTESLSRLLGPINSSMKATATALETLVASHIETRDFIKAMSTAAVSKADEGEDDKEEKEFSEESSSKAKKLLRKAERMIEKAEDSDAKADEKKFLGKAASLLSEARGLAFVARDRDLIKSILATAEDAGIKADLVKAEEDDKDADTDQGKEDDAAEKAKTDAVVEAVKAIGAENATKLEGALKGIGMFEGKLGDIFDALRGQSKQVAAAPNMIKSDTAKTAIDLVVEAIDKKEAALDLSDTELLAARDIVGQFQAVQKGVIPESIVRDRLSKSTNRVQEVFKDFKIAA